MSEGERYIDCSSWTGAWPFLRALTCPLAEHERRLRALGVVGACLSPAEAAFDEDLGAVHDELFRLARGQFFLPVPVVDPSRAGCRRLLDSAEAHGGVRMVRLLPAYHGYPLTEKTIEAVCDRAAGRGWVVSIVMRMEDIRGQYRGLRIEDPDFRIITKVLFAFPENLFLLGNATPDEATALLDSLGNVCVDIAYMERPDVLRTLVGLHGADRLLFSTHFPFYYPEAAVAKLRCSSIGEDAKAAIACGNAARLLGLSADR